jgi:hypothetical protein
MKVMVRPGVIVTIGVVLPIAGLGLWSPSEDAPERVRVVLETEPVAGTAAAPATRRVIPTPNHVDIPMEAIAVVATQTMPIEETTTVISPSTTLPITIPASPRVAQPDAHAEPDVEIIEEVRWVTGMMPVLSPVDAATADAVRSAVHEAWATHVASLRAPEDATLEADASRRRSGYARYLIDSRVSEYRAMRLYATPAFGIPTTLTVAAVAALDSDRMIATYCVIDSEIIMERDGDPRGGDSFHNTAVAREQGRFGLLRSADGWLIDDIAVTDRQVLHPQAPSEVPPC